MNFKMCDSALDLLDIAVLGVVMSLEAGETFALLGARSFDLRVIFLYQALH